MWSLGVILLEIASGCPIGIADKCMLIRNDDIIVDKGFFGVSPDEHDNLKSLIHLQKSVITKIKHMINGN